MWLELRVGSKTMDLSRDTGVCRYLAVICVIRAPRFLHVLCSLLRRGILDVPEALLGRSLLSEPSNARRNILTAPGPWMTADTRCCQVAVSTLLSTRSKCSGPASSSKDSKDKLTHLGMSTASSCEKAVGLQRSDCDWGWVCKPR